MTKCFVTILLFILFLNPVFAKGSLSENFLTDKSVIITEDETVTIDPGSLIEIYDSRFESGCSQLKVDGSLKIFGNKKEPAIVTFKERAFSRINSGIRPIEINQETLLHLPEETEIVQYKTKEYAPEEFEREIYEHTFKGFPIYALMFVLAAYVTTFR